MASLAKRQPAVRSRRRGLAVLSTLTLFVLALAMSFASAASAPAASGRANDELEKVEAIVKSGLVYVSAEYTGYVHYTTTGGSFRWSDNAFKVEGSCTGFAIDNIGHILTAGHCVDPAEANYVLIKTFLEDQVQDRLLTAGDANTILNDPETHKQWKLSGASGGTAPASVSVTVVQSVVPGGSSASRPYQAAVIENHPLADGDITLLKVEPAEPLPALEFAPVAPQDGQESVSFGYPAKVDKLVDPGSGPTSEPGHVTNASQTLYGHPFFQTNAQVTHGMSGGPVTNMQAQYWGLNSFGPADNPGSFNFATGHSTLKGVLDRNMIHPELNEADKAFRAGLDAYFDRHYHKAADLFTTTLNTEPSNAQAQKYRSLAVQNYPNEPTDWISIALWAVSALFIAALVIGGIWLVRTRRVNPGAGTGHDSSSKQCPKCQKVYPETQEFCGEDGFRLTSMDHTKPINPVV